jgi:hypothetical protein
MASPYTPTSPAAPLPPGVTSPVPDPAAAGNRALGRRPSLPGGRALIGAALVVAAAVLTYAAYLGANAGPGQTYVVPRRDLQPNDRVAAADFRVVAGDLPAEVARGAFATAAELDGAVVLAPLTADALVSRSAVSTSGGGAERAEGFEVSFTVPRWKLGGDRVRAGELIDLVPTGDRNEPRAAGPVRNVRVIDRSEGTTGLGSATGDVTVSVSAPDQTTYLGIVDVVRGEFWVVRSTRAAGSGTPPAAVSPTTAAAPTTNGFGFPATPGPAATTPAAPSTTAAAAVTTTTARRP